MPRPTLGHWMIGTAILAVNGGLLRAFLMQEMFMGGILMVVALQFALWRLRRSTDRRQRFWLGFLVGGTTATLALFVAEELQKPAVNCCFAWYEHAVFGVLFATMTDPMLDFMEDRWDLLLPVVYFLPELVAALVGGVGCCFLASSRLGDSRDQVPRVRSDWRP